MTEGLQLAPQRSGYGGDFLTVAQENHGQLSKLRTEGSQTEKGFTMDEGPSSTLDESVIFGPNLTAEDSIVRADDCGGPLYRPVIRNSQTTDTCTASGTDGEANDAGAGLISTDVQLDSRPSVTLQLRSTSEVAALRSAVTTSRSDTATFVNRGRSSNEWTHSKLKSRTHGGLFSKYPSLDLLLRALVTAWRPQRIFL